METGTPQQKRTSRSSVPSEVAEVMRAAGFEPLVPYPGLASVAWECRCLRCGGVTLPRLGRARRGLAKCQHCSRQEVRARKIAERLDYLLTIMRDAGLEPLDPFVATSKKWRSRCLRCSREVSPTFDSVKVSRTGIGCTFCSGGATDPNEAVRVMLERGFEPLEPFPGNVYTDWLYRCLSCGHEGSRPYFNTKTNGYDCPACSARRKRPDPVQAAETMRQNGYEPLVEFPGSRDPWPSLCLRCGDEGLPVYNRVTQGRGAGCCNTRHDLTRPGHQMGLYLVTHDALDAVKVGIGLVRNGKSERIQSHINQGWVLHQLWTGFPSLRAALDIEKSVLRAWRGAGLAVHLSAEDMPQRGHTETARLSEVDLPDVEALVSALAVAEGVDALLRR